MICTAPVQAELGTKPRENPLGPHGNPIRAGHFGVFLTLKPFRCSHLFHHSGRGTENAGNILVKPRAVRCGSQVVMASARLAHRGIRSSEVNSDFHGGCIVRAAELSYESNRPNCRHISLFPGSTTERRRCENTCRSSVSRSSDCSLRVGRLVAADACIGSFMGLFAQLGDREKTP
jgi:hypothetical protein